MIPMGQRGEKGKEKSNTSGQPVQMCCGPEELC